MHYAATPACDAWLMNAARSCLASYCIATAVRAAALAEWLSETYI
jgi:hypothetical protein